MRYIKQHIILTFSIFLLLITLMMGALGFWLSYSMDKKFDDAGLTWTFPLTDEYTSIETTEDGFIGYRTVDLPAAPDTEMAFYLDESGEVLRTEHIKVFPNGLYYLKERDEYGAITDEGEVIIEAKYDHIDGYDDYIVGGSKDYAYDLYTKDGELILSTGEESTISHIENDLFYVVDEAYYLFHADTREKQELDYMFDIIKSNDHGGYWGMSGERFFKLDEAYMPIYDDVQYQHLGTLSEDGLRYVEIYNPEDRYTPRCAYISQDEEIIIDLGKKFINSAAPFSEGKALIQENGRLYCIDMTGKKLFQLKDRVPESAVNSRAIFSDGYAPVTLDGKTYGYINDQGEWVIEPVFVDASTACAGHAAVSLNGVTYGIIDVSAGGEPNTK